MDTSTSTFQIEDINSSQKNRRREIGVVPFECEGRLGGIQGVVPFGCEGGPGVVYRVLFPSGVKEDQLCWVL
ncbi:hypothetical protein Taro_003070 [Colocasia esculenta]|uniref:Uncharacterized protein n=1 Tax=Colocasia esculenta TaxID=4460 RepID=A0A843TMM4_COLES|nr:hypothetical protein [Colocasia esculenta]